MRNGQDGEYLVITPRTYYDLVEMDRFLEANYDEFKGTGGTDRSFHCSIQRGEHSQDELVTVYVEELADSLEDQELDYYEGHVYGDYIRRSLLGIRLLVEDGHLPDQPEYSFHVWW